MFLINQESKLAACVNGGPPVIQFDGVLLSLASGKAACRSKGHQEEVFRSTDVHETGVIASLSRRWNERLFFFASVPRPTQYFCEEAGNTWDLPTNAIPGCLTWLVSSMKRHTFDTSLEDPGMDSLDPYL